jgi:hypothetical protein
MRLWSVHPKYLDSKGLVALWREGLLAQKVLDGKTKGYTRHPQLQRFKQKHKPLKLIGLYLVHIFEEASRRSYNFDSKKIILSRKNKIQITVTREQINYETRHLLKKLKVRDKTKYREIVKEKSLATHPIFRIVPGPIEEWEIR